MRDRREQQCRLLQAALAALASAQRCRPTRQPTHSYSFIISSSSGSSYSFIIISGCQCKRSTCRPPPPQACTTQARRCTIQSARSPPWHCSRQVLPLPRQRKAAASASASAPLVLVGQARVQVLVQGR